MLRTDTRGARRSSDTGPVCSSPLLEQCEEHLGHWRLEMTTRFQLTSQVEERPVAALANNPEQSEEGGHPPSGPTVRGVIEDRMRGCLGPAPRCQGCSQNQSTTQTSATGHSLTWGHGCYLGPDISAFTRPRTPRPGPTHPWGAPPAPHQAARHRETASAPKPVFAQLSPGYAVDLGNPVFLENDCSSFGNGFLSSCPEVPLPTPPQAVPHTPGRSWGSTAALLAPKVTAAGPPATQTGTACPIGREAGTHPLQSHPGSP